MYVVVDFDGTMVTHEYPNVGKDIGAVPVLKALVENGHKIICFTMRGPGTKEEAEAKAWFEQNDIPLYGFNENPDQASWSQSRKVYGHIYIDDAALGCPLCYPRKISDRPFVNWYAILDWFEQKNLIGDPYSPERYKMKQFIQEQQSKAAGYSD